MKIKLLGPVNHNNELHEEGDTLDLPNAEAQALIDVGAAERSDVAAQAAAAKGNKGGKGQAASK